MSNVLIVCALALFTSLILSKLIIHFLGRRLLDTPNHRSSHQVPTPRGGGIALVCGVMASSLLAWHLGLIAPETIYRLLLLSVLMALLGICDDLLNLRVGIRLLAQILLAGCGVLFIGVNDEWPTVIQLLAVAFLILLTAWITNLYNFMDGINGLAALEAISVCAGMGIIYWILSTNSSELYLLSIIAASSCGFLFWNFPKAKLFMGDSGSLFLGFIFGLLIVHSARTDILLTSAWLIMLAAFIADASYTLAYRFLTKQPIHQAHRTHAYQKAAKRFTSHTATTLLITSINLCWLFPIAIGVITIKLNPVAALILAYAPLLLLVHKLQAGKIERASENSHR